MRRALLSASPAVKLPSWLRAERALPSLLSLRTRHVDLEGFKLVTALAAKQNDNFKDQTSTLHLYRAHQSRMSVDQKSATLPSPCTTLSLAPVLRPLGYLQKRLKAKLCFKVHTHIVVVRDQQAAGFLEVRTERSAA